MGNQYVGAVEIHLPLGGVLEGGDDARVLHVLWNVLVDGDKECTGQFPHEDAIALQDGNRIRSNRRAGSGRGGCRGRYEGVGTRLATEDIGAREDLDVVDARSDPDAVRERGSKVCLRGEGGSREHDAHDCTTEGNAHLALVGIHRETGKDVSVL